MTAEEIARDLFTDGRGKHYSHLSLDDAKALGWCETVVSGKIRAAMAAAIQEAQAATVEACAKLAEVPCMILPSQPIGTTTEGFVSKAIRALSPIDMAEHDRKARLEEALWWWGQERETDRFLDGEGRQRLASLQKAKEPR